jgi:succinyl-diaminopimelate desuccinylase
MSDSRRQQLAAIVESMRDDLVRLTQDLVRIPSVNPPGEDYAGCARLVGDRLRPHGFAIEEIRATGAPADSEKFPRINVFARLDGADPGPCVHFNSHYDVVPVGEGWTVDPFGGEVRDGRVYGRGTCDMKGGLAASMIAAAALAQLGGWPGRVEVSGVADEETGGFGGAEWLARNGYFAPDKQNHVIIPEPFGPTRICTGHRGVWWGEITTHGRIAHGSMPYLGDCAVRHMGAVLERIEQDLIPRLSTRRTAMPCAPEGSRVATINIASVHGGQPEISDGFLAPNVPDRAKMVFDRRYIVEEDPEQVKGEMRALLDGLVQSRPDFSYELKTLFEVRPTLADEAGLVVTATAAAIREVTGATPEIVCSPGTYDQRYIDQIGGVKDCIAYGPGILDLAHQPDEYVDIEDLVASAKVMALAALALLEG